MRVTGAQQGAEAVAETPVFASGQTFRLGDVAKVSHGYEDPPSFLIRAQGEPALEVGVVMQKGGNILALGKALDATLADFETELPRGVTISRIADQPQVVDKAVGEFTRSFVEALAIVLAVSFLSLGWRAGFVVATSVPLVLAIVFVAMAALGLDLQRVTLGALIIALGLLVDDAIIATEMIVVKLEQGWERERAASFAWTSTAFPMLTGTLVTAAGFLPIGLANSAVGEYTARHFLGRRHRARRLVVRRRAVHPLSRLQALAELCARRPCAERKRNLRDAFLPRLPPRPRILRLAPDRRHCCRGRVARTGPEPVQQGSTAILSAVRTAGIILRAEACRRLRDSGDRSDGERGRAADRRATPTRYRTRHTSARARRRFWLGLQPVQPNESFAQIVIVARDVEARERIKARIEAAVAKGALSAARVGSTGSISARRLDFRSSFASSDRNRTSCAKPRRACATSCAPIRG